MEAHPYKDMPHLNRCSEWVIAFAPYRGRSLLKKWLLNPSCGHVWAFTEIQGNTLLFDPFLGGYFSAVTKPQGTQSKVGITPAILASAFMQEREVKMLRYKGKFPKSRGHLANIVPSCVTMVKLLVGLRSFALTPHQLYNTLLKHKAEPVSAEVLKQMLGADQHKRSQHYQNL